jgi:hypothetical protein
VEADPTSHAPVGKLDDGAAPSSGAVEADDRGVAASQQEEAGGAWVQRAELHGSPGCAAEVDEAAYTARAVDVAVCDAVAVVALEPLAGWREVSVGGQGLAVAWLPVHDSAAHHNESQAEEWPDVLPQLAHAGLPPGPGIVRLLALLLAASLHARALEDAARLLKLDTPEVAKAVPEPGSWLRARKQASTLARA